MELELLCCRQKFTQSGLCLPWVSAYVQNCLKKLSLWGPIFLSKIFFATWIYCRQSCKSVLKNAKAFLSFAKEVSTFCFLPGFSNCDTVFSVSVYLLILFIHHCVRWWLSWGNLKSFKKLLLEPWLINFPEKQTATWRCELCLQFFTWLGLIS